MFGLGKKEKEERKKDLEIAIGDANSASQILNSHVFKSAFDVRRANIFDVFCSTKADQPEVRDEAWRTMQNLLALERYFKEIIESGKFSQKELESLNKLEGAK
jgi:hypothetical protein